MNQPQQQIVLIARATNEQELLALRMDTVVESFNSARRRFSQAKASENAAYACYHEALLGLSEDEDDDWDVAREKAEKLERIESEYVNARPVVEAALLRVGFDAREAQRAGINIS